MPSSSRNAMCTGYLYKVLHMSMANLLLGGDPTRERWVTAGTTMVAVDTLVHMVVGEEWYTLVAESQAPIRTIVLPDWWMCRHHRAGCVAD